MKLAGKPVESSFMVQYGRGEEQTGSFYFVTVRYHHPFLLLMLQLLTRTDFSNQGYLIVW